VYPREFQKTDIDFNFKAEAGNPITDREDFRETIEV
jgi:hypothetical protein